ncbi:putative aspartate aminotransferase [Histomonas meleagridis]|uniref:putative aspartate aminotransferase n=1 Tax=Histomonas meleagridis TaxID=135588 RepID=UPI0035593E63|nr:putative aspartate aminotransferase [Histomonas meleagridis]KAH0800673.1 putative aspartate aminotransferase [Histomonas meleagridis]
MLSPYMLKVSTRGSMIRKMSDKADALAEQYGPDAVHNFSLGNPRIPPPPEYYKALIEVANEEFPLSHGYSSTMGDLACRKVFAEMFSKIQDVQIGPEHIVLTSGCAGAMNVVLRTILSAGDEVCCVAPYFLEYPFYVENFHGTVVDVPTTFEEGWQINAQRLEEYITPLTRCVIINSPQNPTGIVYTQECVDAMCEVLKRKSKEYGRPIYILSDDVYTRVVAPGVHCHKIFKSYPHSIIAYSVSKDISIPGERFGCMIVNPLLENNKLLIHCLAHSNEILGFVHANRLHMRIIPKVMPATSNVELYNKSRDIICKMLDDCGIKYVKPEGTFYIFPKIPDGIGEWEFCEKMADHFVIIVPGSGFKAPGFFRLSYCKPPEDIERAVPAFKAAFAEVMKNKK